MMAEQVDRQCVNTIHFLPVDKLAPPAGVEPAAYAKRKDK